MTIWTNNDGLRVKFLEDERVQGQGGTYATAAFGDSHVTEITFDSTDVGAAAAVIDDHIVIPAGARIERVDLIVQTAFTSGGAATLDFGLIRTDRSTELDYNGLIAAGALSTINAVGELNTYINAGTGAGALVGTVLANAGVPTVNYGTAAFTAGKAKVRIYWSIDDTINS